jgi:hypothetical protein
MRLAIILAVTAFALAGCNANQRPNASIQASLGASPIVNPVRDAQTSGFYAGR